MADTKGKIGVVKRFFSPIKGNSWFMIKPILVSCVYAIFSIATVEVFKYATSCIQNSDFRGIKISIFVYVGIFLVHIIFSRFCKNIGWASMNYEGKKHVQREWLPKFFKLDNTYIEKIGIGKMQHIIDQGFITWKSLFSDIASSVPSLLITAIFVLYQIYLAAGIIAVIIFVVLFLCLFFVINYFNKYAIKWRKVRTGLNADYNRHLIKMLMSKMEIVQNNRESQEIKVADDLVTQATQVNLKVGLYLWIVTWASRVFSRLLNVFILFYGFLIVKSGGNISLFVGLLVCSTLFSNEFEQFTYFYKNFTDQFANVQKLWDTFDEIPNMKNQYSSKPFVYKKGSIEIKNIYFGYVDEHNIFEKFSLDIDGGEKTALVGESGGGKSTLIKLIAGYLSPDKGNIFIDGQDIGEVNIHDYFKNIGYLTQDPSVFDGSVYENLVYALNYKPSDSQIKKVIKSAKCEFIYDFAEGLQTEIGERGIRLSGGQKQRLAIAKIMLKNPNIILLDEPTSALDSFNEEEISQALNNLFKGKTVIIVAHRLQTVKSADRILLFENGKVVEDGTHQSLIKKNGKYKRMLDLQSGF